MANATTRRGSTAGNEADRRLLDLGEAQEVGGLLLGRAADLADHDDRAGLGVCQEELQDVDELGALDGVAADSDGGGLTEPGIGCLFDGLICQGPGTRHDADRALLEDVARHDADLALVRGDDAGAVRPDQPGLGAVEGTLDLDHVHHRDAFGDADGERDLGGDRLEDGVGGKGRRDIDRRGIGAGLGDGGGNRVEHRQAELDRAAAAGGDAADHAGAIGDRLLGVEGALGAGDALADDLGLAVDEDRHHAASLTAATTFLAASSRSLAAMTLRPDSFRIFLPSSTLVPSSRTTSGTSRPTSLTAAITPSAMMSQRMMPPKILTRMPWTWVSEVMILNAAVTFSRVAPPPTSRKLAGLAP